MEYPRQNTASVSTTMDSCSYDSSFYNGTWIIVPEDLTVVITFRGHYGGSDLAQAYAMAPARAMKDYPAPSISTSNAELLR